MGSFLDNDKKSLTYNFESSPKAITKKSFIQSSVNPNS